MSIIHMALREILRRQTTFLLATLAVAVAVGTMLTAQAALQIYDLRSDALLAQKETELQERLNVLQDEMRKATLKLSFNMAILPGDQDVGEWHASDTATTTMPEDYAHRLANSRIVSVRHFLPMLAEKLKWPEMKRTVILVGCKGEVANLHKSPKTPLVQPVPDGTMVVGYELHRSLGLQEGQQVELLGRPFVIHKCQEERGSKDDIGVWIPLQDAQELLGKPGRINAILALECLCVGSEALARVRADVAKQLPDTKVVELGTKVLARAEARTRVGQEAAEALQREKSHQQALRAERRRLASLAVPGVVLACGAWIFLTAFGNARGRRAEVAILRAIGYRANQVLTLFLFRSLAGGVVGAAFGCAAGLLIAARLRGDLNVLLVGAAGLLSWQVVGAALAIGSLLGVVAGWIPALLAAQRDPAEILREA
ncbi:MAG: FtsX-like permease family protein [Candidatus Anammoximicrobium sp.]|nr:FtsX-like permease family protein [Candidatus Anammoximicrobium sp.]